MLHRGELEFLEVASGDNPQASIIWLHGLGADGHDFTPIVAQLALPANLNLRFIFPHAPLMPITINGGAVMRGWYDIRALGLLRDEDETGIRSAQHLVEKLIQNELERGIHAHRIVLAGFSQGGAIALYTAFRYQQKLAGVLALSTYLPLASSFLKEVQPGNLAVPIFLAHGLYDNVIPLAGALATRELLTQAGSTVAWHEYEMGHAVCEAEIMDIRAWLVEILQANK